MSGRTYYITTPIYYVNDVPHIGHAYTTLACDVLARFMRLDGRDVHFLTGTDEHGQKVEKAAAAAGLAPQAFTDKVSQSFRDLVRTMNYSPDNFIRTTEKRHYVAAQALWEKLVASGDIYLGKYAGWYSVRDEAYFVEGETEVGPDNKRPRHRQRRRGRVGRGAVLLLQAVGVGRQAAGLLRGESRFHRARVAPQRGDQPREDRAARCEYHPLRAGLGHPPAMG